MDPKENEACKSINGRISKYIVSYTNEHKFRQQSMEITTGTNPHMSVQVHVDANDRDRLQPFEGIHVASVESRPVPKPGC